MNRLPIGLVLEGAVVQLVLVKPLSTQDLLQFDSVSGGLVGGHQGDIFEVDGKTESRTLLLLLLVEVGEVGGLSEDEDEQSSPTRDVDLESGKVVRVLLGKVDLRSDDLQGGSRGQRKCRGIDFDNAQLTFPTHWKTNMMAVVHTRLVEPAAFKLAQV
jgi:hypothetical protein